MESLGERGSDDGWGLRGLGAVEWLLLLEGGGSGGDRGGRGRGGAAWAGEGEGGSGTPPPPLKARALAACSRPTGGLLESSKKREH
jgi:hypothetical protein